MAGLRGCNPIQLLLFAGKRAKVGSNQSQFSRLVVDLAKREPVKISLTCPFCFRASLMGDWITSSKPRHDGRATTVSVNTAVGMTSIG